MKKKYWYIISAVAVIAMIINIIFSCIWRNTASNIFTAISGWISGISTIILGILAIFVNSKYKADEDEQVWKNQIYKSIEMYRTAIYQSYTELKNFNYANILERLMDNFVEEKSSIYGIIEKENIQCCHMNLLFNLGLCAYYFEDKEKLYEDFLDFIKALNDMIDNAEKIILQNDFDKIMQLRELYQGVLAQFKLHISSLDIFLSRKIYYTPKSELKEILNQKKSQQRLWWEEHKKYYVSND